MQSKIKIIDAWLKNSYTFVVDYMCQLKYHPVNSLSSVAQYTHEYKHELMEIAWHRNCFI